MYIGMKTSEDIILSSGEFVGFPSECLMIEFFIFSFNLICQIFTSCIAMVKMVLSKSVS